MRYLISSIVLCLAVVCFADPESSETDIEIKVIVNVNDNADPSGLIEAIDKANEILKGAKITLEWHQTRPNESAGDPDGNGLSRDQRDDVRENGQEVLNDEVGAGKGIKIDLVNRVSGEDEGVLGVAVHRNPVVIVSPDSDPNEFGRTIAHEICHSLTISYDLYDPNDIERLMYGYSGSGTTLTDEEIDEIRRGARLRGVEALVIPEPVYQGSTTSGGGKSYVLNAFGAILDDFSDMEINGENPPYNPDMFGYADIREVTAFAPQLYIDDPIGSYGDVSIAIQSGNINPEIPPFFVDSFFDVFFQTPDGISLGHIAVNAQNFNVMQVQFFDGAGNPTPLPIDAQIITENEFMNVPHLELPANYTLLISAPSDIFQPMLANFEPVIINVVSHHIDQSQQPHIMIFDNTEMFDFAIETPKTRQNVAVSKHGGSIAVLANGFNPGEEVMVEVVDYDTRQILWQSDALSNPDGTIEHIVPEMPEGKYAVKVKGFAADPTTNQTSYANAVVVNCNEGVKPADLNGDCTVDMNDLRIFASNWLQ